MKSLFGRRKLYTVVENITAENVVQVLNAVLPSHFKNYQEENYLYWYRRGQQPVLNRTKEIRPEINNKVCENLSSQLVSFKNGYFLTQPTFYTSRKEDEEISEEVNELNDYLYLSGKAEADNNIVDWFHTVGLGVLFVESVDDDEAPMKCYALDPRQSFVVYSRRYDSKPVMAVNMVSDGMKDDQERLIFDVFTKDKIFHINGGMSIRAVSDNEEVTVSGTAINVESEEPNLLGEIPMIEYSFDRNRMACFEAALPLLDAVNEAQSNRLDSEIQHVNSLLVFYNCELGDDDDGNAITPSYIRQYGAVFLKSVGQEKADLKEIASALDQTQTQVLVDDLVKQICDISGMPHTAATDRGTSDNTGAVYLRNGWSSADTHARNTEDIFREANRQFDKIFLNILHKKHKLKKLKPSDLDTQFVRNEMDNLLVKTQCALNLKSLGFSPELVFEKSGISNDPVGDVAKSKPYIDVAYLLPDAQNVDEQMMGSGNDAAAGAKTGTAQNKNDGQQLGGSDEQMQKGGGHWVSGYYR